VIVALGANISGYAAAIRQAKDVTVDFSKSAIGYAQQHEAQIDQLAGTATRAGLVLVAMGGYAIKSAMDWETAWTGVLKTVDGTSSQLSQLETDLRELAVSTGFAHSEVAAVAEAAGQLGVATENVAAFTETMLALGVSTNLTADEAATAIAQMANVMGTSANDIDNLASTLVALGNDGASTEAQIIQMAQRISGAAKTVGMSEAEVLAFANTVASLGIEVEAGGTAVSTVISTMAREVANGGTKLEAFARTANLSSAQFAAAFKSEPTMAIQAFVEGLGRIQAEGGNVYGVLQEIGLSDVRVSQALIGMASAGDLLADSLETGAEAWAQNTALMAEAEKFYNTTAQKGKQTWAQIRDDAITAGEAMLPVVGAVLDVVMALGEAFGALPDWAQSGVIAFSVISGAALLAAAGLAKLLTSIASTRVALADLGSGGSGKAAGVISTIGAVAARAAVAVAAFYAANQIGEGVVSRNTSEISNLADELERFGKTGDVGKDLSNTFGPELQGEARRFQRDVRSIGEAIEELSKYGDDNGLTRSYRRLVGGLTAGDPFADTMYKAADGIRDVDAAFVQLSRNKPEEAIEAFERFRDEALLQGRSVEEVALAFPSMTEVLRSASVAIGGTSDASAILNGDLAELGPAAAASAEQLAQLNERVSGAASTWRDLSNEVDGNVISFEAWLTQLEEQQAALAGWADNMAAIAERGASQEILDELFALGSEGAQQVQWLANASDEEFARYVASAEGSAAITQQLIDRISAIASPPTIEVTTSGIPEALTQLGSLLDTLTGVPGSFNILATPSAGSSTSRPTSGPSIRAIEGRAMGGPIIGPGTGTSDDVLFWGSNGEHVLRANEVRAMGGHEGVYEIRRAAMRGAFSSKPASYTAQAQSFGSLPSTGQPLNLDALLSLLPAQMRAGAAAGVADGFAAYGVLPGDNMRLTIESR
jgi:TP901 family phage tail tape measure protein